MNMRFCVMLQATVDILDSIEITTTCLENAAGKYCCSICFLEREDVTASQYAAAERTNKTLAGTCRRLTRNANKVNLFHSTNLVPVCTVFHPRGLCICRPITPEKPIVKGHPHREGRPR